MKTSGKNSKKIVAQQKETAKRDVSKKSTDQKNTTNLFQQKWIQIAGVFAFSFLLYFNTISFDYALDDLIATTDNRFVQKGISGIDDIFTKGYYFGNTGRNDNSYRPLSLAFIALQTQFFGNAPHLNHFFNVLFYALTCVFVYLFLRKLLKLYNFVIPLAITLVFAAHPIHTEVVANIKSLDEVFHLFFISLSLLYFIKYVDENQKWSIAISLIMYFLALLSKENAITFLAVIPLILFIFTEKSIKQIILRSLPFFGVAAVYMLIRLSVLDAIAIANPIVVYANGLIAAQTPLERIATNMVIHGKYLLLLIFPHPLSWDYSYNEIPIVGFGNIKAIFSTIVLLALAGIGIFGGLKKKIWGFAILYYFITISVVSNFIITLEATMGERFIYTPSLSFAILLVLGLVFVLKINPLIRIRNNYFYALLGIILFLFSVKTMSRNVDWKNNLSIYQSGVRTSPNSARTHLSLGSEYRVMFQKETDQIKRNEYFTRAIQEYNRSIEIFAGNPEVYFHLGYMYYTMNDKQMALQTFFKTIQYDPKHVNVLNYIGIIYAEQNELEKAEEYFSKVINIDPKYAHAYNNLIYIYRKLNKPEKAIELYKIMLTQDPTSDKGFSEMGALYSQMGKYTEAIEKYEKAIELNPKNKAACSDLAKIYEKTGNAEKAALYFQKAK